MNTQKINPCAKSRCRQVMVMGGHLMNVPRHITRVEGPHTQGWQVRFSTPSKFFSDGYGSMETSLKKAKRYLKSIYVVEKKITSRDISRRNRNVGIRKYVNEKGHTYIEATHPIHGKSPKRFYIGTEKTKTVAKEKEAIRKAKAQRKIWLDNLPRPIR